MKWMDGLGQGNNFIHSFHCVLGGLLFLYQGEKKFSNFSKHGPEIVRHFNIKRTTEEVQMK